jgi:hypothetical protein
MKAFALLAFAALAGAAASAQEAPPPPVEADLPPGARLIDPRADELVRQMSDLLASTKSFALEAEEIYDEVPEQLPRTQLTNLRHLALRRPDRMVGEVSGDALNRSFWYDGKTVSILEKEQNTYATVPVPSTIDAARWLYVELRRALFSTGGSGVAQPSVENPAPWALYRRAHSALPCL